MIAALFLVSALMFCVGLYLMITRRHAVMMLIGVELILNAANLNFVSFNTLYPEPLDGQILALFVLLIAAAEAAVALAIILNFSEQFGTVELDRATTLQESTSTPDV